MEEPPPVILHVDMDCFYAAVSSLHSVRAFPFHHTSQEMKQISKQVKPLFFPLIPQLLRLKARPISPLPGDVLWSSFEGGKPGELLQVGHIVGG